MKMMPTLLPRSTFGTQGGSHCVGTLGMAGAARQNTWFVTLYEDHGNTRLGMIRDGPMSMDGGESGKGRSKLYFQNMPMQAFSILMAHK